MDFSQLSENGRAALSELDLDVLKALLQYPDILKQTYVFWKARLTMSDQRYWDWKSSIRDFTNGDLPILPTYEEISFLKTGGQMQTGG